MPRRIDSDDDDSDDKVVADTKTKKRRASTAAKRGNTKPPPPPPTTTTTTRTRNAAKSKKAASKSTSAAADPLITAWTNRRTVQSLDGIDDINDHVTPKKETKRPAFKIDDNVDRIPTVAQLAVHKKKVAEVSNWLKEFPHHRKKLLVLSGPAGAGKSTTVLSLAKSIDYQVVEWINPVDANKLGTPPEDNESLSRKFAAFLQGSQRYASLDADNATNQIVLIQDLPNTIGSSTFMAQARTQFQTTLKEFLVSQRVRYPVILIVTESEIGSGEDFGYSSSFSRDGLTVQQLLGEEILNHRATAHITFNPIAKTIMSKSLAEMFKTIPKTVMGVIIENSAGDIRSAINCASLVAIQLHYSPKLKKDVSILAGLECREGGLDLFHAAGRVVYNKRFGDDRDDNVVVVEMPSLPPHLQQWTRRQSKVDIDDLLTAVQTDALTLRSLIHHNFPPSCFDADDLDNVSSVLSDTDFLFPVLSGTSPTQERLAAYYTVGGVLLGLPSPVAKRSEYTMMRWPEATRLPRRTKEMSDKFEKLCEMSGISSGKREDLLLDVFPLWRRIDRHLGMKEKWLLQGVCGFPLRGKHLVEDVEMEDDQVQVVHTHSGGWLFDDDIED